MKTQYHHLGTLFFTITFILLAALVLTSCNNRYVPPSTPSSPTPSSPTPTTPAPEQIQHPPLTIDLDYYAIKSTRQGTSLVPPKIQLYVMVEDGKTKETKCFPPNNEGMVMDDFHLEDLTSQGEIFRTSKVGEYLKISVLAYSCEDKETMLGMWRMIEAFEPDTGTMLRQMYEQMPQKKVLIGYYDNTWTSADGWGTTPGSYEEVGSNDLKLWFRVWSEDEPEAIAKPIFLPDVKILSVDIPYEVKRAPDLIQIPAEYMYTHTLIIGNSESMDIWVDWKAHSSVTGDFAGGGVLVPAGGQTTISEDYWYKTAGSVEISYTIAYRGVELDRWEAV
jgi:hypothetical protein